MVLEALKEITAWYLDRVHHPEDSPMAEDLRRHTLQHAGHTMGVELGPGKEFKNLNIKSLIKIYFSSSRC